MLNKLCFLLISAALAVPAADLHLGVWTLDVEKSKYVGQPAPKSETVTITADETSFQVSFDALMANGAPFKGSFRFPLKGGAVDESGMPREGKPAEMDHARVEVVGDQKWIFHYFDKNNKLTSKRVVTTDGKVTRALWSAGGKVIWDEVTRKQ